MFGDASPLPAKLPHENPEHEVLFGSELVVFNVFAEVLEPSLSDGALASTFISGGDTWQEGS